MGTYYTAFGLAMAGISSKAAGGVENKKKYNGIEFENDLDVDAYDAFYRNLDPQIARWWQIDPVTDGYESISPYASMYNNPITISDPLGNEGEDCCKALWSIAGGAAAVLDNATGINLRSALAPSANDPEAVEAYNNGQNGGDIASMVIGASETTTGGGLVLGGGTVAVTGVGAVPGGATAALGVGMSAHGLFTMGRASNSLATQKDRVQANSGSSSGGSPNKQKNAPQQNGTPNSSKIEAKDASGKTTKYSTYGGDGNLKKQVQVDKGTSRHGVTGATKKVPVSNTNPNTGTKHMNGYKIKKAMPAETPPGSN